MHHVAIFNPKHRLLPKLLSGQKTIEFRWYKARFNPRNNISAGDKVFFKDSGKPVTLQADVKKVLQFELTSEDVVKDIIFRYGKDICISDYNYQDWSRGKKYCILVFVDNIQKIKPFEINKAGFGISCAWLCVENIDLIKKLV